MKNKLFIVLTCIVLSIVAISCNNNPAHTHSYDVNDWKKDETNHWHVCTTCGEKLDLASHTFGSWEILSDTQVDRNCKVCSQSEIVDGVFVSTADELAKAFGESDNIIYLGADITLTNSIKVSTGKSYVVDLNGHTIGKDKETFIIEHGKVEFKGTGTIQETADNQYSPIIIKGSDTSTETNYSVVTIGKDVTLKGWAGLFIRESSNKHAYGIVVNMNGKIVVPANESDATPNVHGVYINGNIKDETGNIPQINIDGAEITTNNNAVYAAGYAKWSIKNTKITAKNNGLVVASGEFEIDGGEIEAGSKKGTLPSYQGSITQNTASAIYIKQHTTTPTIKVTVKGGTYSSYIPFYQDKGEATTPQPDKVTLSITGGTFTSNSETGSIAVKSENKTGFITGGIFSTDPKTYIAEGYETKQDGTSWTVVKK